MGKDMQIPASEEDIYPATPISIPLYWIACHSNRSASAFIVVATELGKFVKFLVCAVVTFFTAGKALKCHPIMDQPCFISLDSVVINGFGLRVNFQIWPACLEMKFEAEQYPSMYNIGGCRSFLSPLTSWLGRLRR